MRRKDAQVAGYRPAYGSVCGSMLSDYLSESAGRHLVPKRTLGLTANPLGGQANMIRILVIDDNKEMLDIIGEWLTTAGYEVIKAINGTEGVRLYRRRPFDLVVTDLFMPEKDGLEVTIELRNDFPDVKIIMHSGHAYGDSSLASSKVLGTARTLRKPFTEEELLQAVREVLESG